MVRPQKPDGFADFRKIDLPTRVSVPLGGFGNIAGRYWSKLRRRTNPWFLGIVVLPTFLAAIYYGLIAANVYVSETKFVIHTRSASQTNVLGGLLQSSGLSQGTDTTFAVIDFMGSRDAVNLLEKSNQLRAVLNRPEADYFSKFPSLFTGDSFEELYRAYSGVLTTGFVYAYYDSTTGISDLQVKAFRPEDAQAVAVALLQYGEQLVNRMNERAIRAAVEVATAQVSQSEQRVARSQTKVRDFRNRESMVNPSQSSNTVLDLIAKLSGDLANSKAQLSELLKASPNSPQIAPVANHIAAVEKQIAEEGLKVVGDERSIAPKISEFELLSLEREFADKQLASATVSLEAARIEAQRQQLYLDHVVEPNLPDYPLFPKRLLDVLAVLVGTLLLYGISWLLVTGIREHATS
jgi:capsular polysaccharide transport system permease protein